MSRVEYLLLVRLLRSTKPEDQAMMERIGVVWPNQSDFGTHINVSGGGMLKTAPHKDAALKFLEYLASTKRRPISPTATTNGRW
jgi:iron(III) transport system substrate-binding protein